MKPRNRDINIFNLSMMDVISGALGAFLIIVIVLLPYYKKDLAEENRQLQQKLQVEKNARQKAEQARQQAEQARKQAEQRVQAAQQAQKECEDRLAQTFIVVLIKWKTARQDIDLHVIDPEGNEFYFDQTTFPGRPGELSEDDKVGPGLEVWEIRNAPPGIYRVYYNLFSRKRNNKNPVVSGRIFYRDGSRKIRDTRLTRLKTKILVATITVKANGIVDIR